MTKKSCIFCGSEYGSIEFADEHVFPDAIGGLLVLKDKVCKPCNDKLGHSVDAHLVNHGLVSFLRLHYGLKGKSGKVPNPFERGVLKDDPKQQIRYEFTDDGKPKRTYLVPQVSAIKDGEALKVSFSIDESDRGSIPSIMRKIANRHNVHISDDHIKEVLNIPSQESNPTIKSSMKLDFEKYRKAIIKIGYELGCYWLGDEYYHDPVATSIREVIFSNAPLYEDAQRLLLSGKIGFIDGEPDFPFLSDNKACHIAFCHPQSDFISCYVRVFKLFEGHVLLSRCPAKYPTFEGAFIEINVENKSMRELPFLEEVYCASRNHNRADR
ncbi:HNH endonuclease [Geomonas subterranea]|uniref:HNH endonuclease n=1 Tax=Geomonas subterranea TaxID=2847989 RepID=A0ABX8LB13_9BACT|nr:HNH endonuclease [Geomonas subterranea]QXE89182.1 HNH endonuclease [Geomonas subterranea]QXM08703.1 HNH endonuclease [Geomonas subterranea]